MTLRIINHLNHFKSLAVAHPKTWKIGWFGLTMAASSDRVSTATLNEGLAFAGLSSDASEAEINARIKVPWLHTRVGSAYTASIC